MPGEVTHFHMTAKAVRGDKGKRVNEVGREWQQSEAVTGAVGGFDVMMREQETDCHAVEAEVREARRDAGLPCGGNAESLAHLSGP